jgi:hypothetical protein
LIESVAVSVSSQDGKKPDQTRPSNTKQSYLCELFEDTMEEVQNDGRERNSSQGRCLSRLRVLEGRGYALLNKIHSSKKPRINLTNLFSVSFLTSVFVPMTCSVPWTGLD